MPGLYQEHDFDLAGTIIGMVEEDQLLPRSTIEAGDLLIGLPSTGLHTNGFSLARKVLFDKMGLKVDSYVEELSGTLAEKLLAVHRSYLPVLRPHLQDAGLKALAHITGGGIAGNLSRVLPEGLGAEIDLPEDKIPALFHLIQQGGNVQSEVMRQTFNLGVGMICVVSPKLADKLENEHAALRLGELYCSTSTDRVIFK